MRFVLLRSRLLLLAAAGMIPLTLVTGFVLWLLAQQYRTQTAGTGRGFFGHLLQSVIVPAGHTTEAPRVRFGVVPERPGGSVFICRAHQD
jgi:hypothetical protein